MPNCLAKNDPGAELTTCENRSEATKLPFVSRCRRIADELTPE
jgi:hypothetical protein